jgi:hypothetical protein
MSKVENYMDSKEGESQSSEQLGQQTTELKTIHHQDSSLDPGTSSLPPSVVSDLYLPIALRKEKRYCTSRPINNFVSYQASLAQALSDNNSFS